jgi:hypothetical protein
MHDNNMKDEIKAYKELLNNLKEKKESAKVLEVGCEVILTNGEKQIITKTEYGEAQGSNAFYRWSTFFPYEIEHAAMYGSNLEIVDVKWLDPKTAQHAC